MVMRSIAAPSKFECSIKRVNDPHIGTLTVENIGRHDIDSNSFDQGRPIRFEVHRARKAVTFLDHEANPPGLRVDRNSILVGPELLRSKSKWTVSFVTDGNPKIELADSHMINVKISEKPTGAERLNRVDANVFLFVLTIGAVLLTILTIVPTIIDILAHK